MGRAHSTRQPGTSGRPAVSWDHENHDDRMLRSVSAVPAEVRATWLADAQRLAGNRAVLAGLPTIQRDEPAAAPVTAPAPGATQDGPGRVPTREEQGDWDDAFPDQDMATFRILVEPAHGYNCFAWAVGITTMDITSETLGQAGYGSNLDGWTKYLTERHGFGRYADGLDPSADSSCTAAARSRCCTPPAKRTRPTDG